MSAESLRITGIMIPDTAQQDGNFMGAAYSTQGFTDSWQDPIENPPFDRIMFRSRNGLLIPDGKTDKTDLVRAKFENGRIVLTDKATLLDSSFYVDQNMDVIEDVRTYIDPITGAHFLSGTLVELDGKWYAFVAESRDFSDEGIQTALQRENCQILSPGKNPVIHDNKVILRSELDADKQGRIAKLRVYELAKNGKWKYSNTLDFTPVITDDMAQDFFRIGINSQPIEIDDTTIAHRGHQIDLRNGVYTYNFALILTDRACTVAKGLVIISRYHDVVQKCSQHPDFATFDFKKDLNPHNKLVQYYVHSYGDLTLKFITTLFDRYMVLMEMNRAEVVEMAQAELKRFPHAA